MGVHEGTCAGGFSCFERRQRGGNGRGEDGGPVRRADVAAAQAQSAAARGWVYEGALGREGAAASCMQGGVSARRPPGGAASRARARPWRWALALLAAAAMLGPAGVTGQSAKLLENNGGHFRFGNIRWEKLEGNTVQFTIESAWRRDYGSAYWKGSGDDGLTVVGDEIHLNGKQWPVFNYGDDSVTAGEYLKLQVMAYSKSENWIYGESFVTHTYMTPNNKGKPWVASFTGCCKLSEINNQPQMDAPWLLETSIDLIALTASPRLTAMPVISLPDPPILPTPAPQDPTIPKVPVSFYVPGFHPDGHDATVTTLASPLTALSGTITDIDPECDADGKVTLNFHGITEAETADKGMFYFLKLNATSVATGLFVQADFLIRVHKNPEHLMPTIAFGHTDLQNLPGPPTLTSPLNVSAWANGYVPSTPAARFWPDAAYQAYVGFPVNFTVVAQDPNVEQRVGFSAFGLPEYARVTTVQGTNPVQITTFWTPCEGQHGRHVMCYDAVDSFGNTSTAECVNVMVDEDPAPIFGPATDRDGKYQQKTVDMDQVRPVLRPVCTLCACAARPLSMTACMNA